MSCISFSKRLRCSSLNVKIQIKVPDDHFDDDDDVLRHNKNQEQDEEYYRGLSCSKINV